ncbi:DNA repair protein RecO [Candidatus Marinamargulisbacteria bacterium SCGC AG-439-L15]|nr:DNA repair protein RecO [Candidatus Marinamargulisbacteria bacterium SCGC AG-439-L15]
MKTFKVTGIILKSKTLFEKDKMIDIFTLEKGRVRVLGKGFQTPKKVQVGRLEPFNVVTCVIQSGRQFLYCRQCDLLQAFPAIRQSYNKLMMGLFFLDIVYKASAEYQVNTSLYHLLLSTLVELESSDDVLSVCQSFYRQFLKNEGLLYSQDQELSEFEFLRAFENYSGKILSPPRLLT